MVDAPTTLTGGTATRAGGALGVAGGSATWAGGALAVAGGSAARAGRAVALAACLLVFPTLPSMSPQALFAQGSDAPPPPRTQVELGALFAQPPGGPPAPAQERDTLPAFDLDALVVTADRIPIRVATTSSAVSVLRGDQLRARPIRTLAEALEGTPGFALVDLDGAGGDPQPIVRGFYGGGEAEYVLLLLDGSPVTGLRDGRINWDLIPLAAVEAVEVVRGGASSLWGDQALAGVVNVVTRGNTEPVVRLHASGGGLGSVDASGYARGAPGGRSASIWAGLRRTDGFREHAERASGTVGASYALVERPGSSLIVSTLHHRREAERPGPLTATLAEESSRRSVLPFFRLDHREETLHRIGVEGSREGEGGLRWSGRLAGETGGVEEIRTLPLAPFFADTKERHGNAKRLSGSVQADGSPRFAGMDGRVTAGMDFSLGRTDDVYFAVLSGGPDSYQAPAPAGRGERVASGSGTRAGAAAFLQAELRPHPRLRLGAGARLDWLRDRFRDDTAPDAAGVESAQAAAAVDAAWVEAAHLAFSPKVGANLRLVGSDRHEAHLYGAVSRSFKAATPDQLFDQRPIPVPFPPFAITTSNELLEPQHATSFEAGVYQRMRWGAGSWGSEISATAYRSELENQLDFDLERFQYVNLGRSRHQGIETGVKLRHPGGSELFANYTHQRATERGGPHEGRQLKAVPRHFLSAGVVGAHPSGIRATLLSTRMAGVHLDDANTRMLPSFTRIDGGLSFPLNRMRATLDVHNLLDREYSSTGFPDPSGTDVVYLHPAAGRVLRVGLEAAW